MRLILGVAIVCMSLHAEANECGQLFSSVKPAEVTTELALALGKQTRSELTPQEKVSAVNEDRYDQAFDGKIRAEYVPEFKTIRQFSVSGRIPTDAKVRILVTHGSGAVYSHSDAMRSVIRSLGEGRGLAKMASNISRIREYENYTRAALEAIDLPFHGQGNRDENLRNKEDVTQYLIDYLKQMRAETPDLPLVVFGRSSSPSLFVDVLAREPDLIDGVIYMSPVIPLSPEIIHEGTRKAYEMAAQGLFPIYPEGLSWIDHLMINTNWHEESLRGKPALFLTGTDDWEVADIERNFMANLAKNNENVRHIDIPGATHDVFRQTKVNHEKQVLETYKAVQDFLSEIAKSKR